MTRHDLRNILNELADKWLDDEGDITDMIDVLEDKASELREIELRTVEAQVRFLKNKLNNQNKT